MNQRIRVLQELGEQFEHVVQATSPDRGQQPSSRTRSVTRAVRRMPRGAIATAAAVAVPIAIAIGALLLVRAAHHSPAGDAASERSLLAQYSVLRRPQTAADRAQAAPAPSIGGVQSFGAGQGPSPGVETLHYNVHITGLARYQDLPELTRVVNIDGVRVSLFVEHLLRSHALPKATVTGNDPKGAAKEVTRQRLETLQRNANAQPSYVLLARVGRSGRWYRIAPGPSAGGARAKRFAAQLSGLQGVANASLRAPNGRIVAVVPDGVARINWIWPREFNSQTLTYVPSVTLSASVRDNVAVAEAPPRFASAEEIDPETVVHYAADGSLLGRFTDPSNSASAYQTTTSDSQVPGPETAQSRRAERDPTTPNRIVIVPDVITLHAVTLGPGAQFFFKVLLNHRGYFLRVAGGPRPGCIKSDARSGPGDGAVLQPLAQPTVRGDTYEGSTGGIINVSCRGVYRLSISVLNADKRPYPPFGSATFTVR